MQVPGNKVTLVICPAKSNRRSLKGRIEYRHNCEGNVVISKISRRFKKVGLAVAHKPNVCLGVREARFCFQAKLVSTFVDVQDHQEHVYRVGQGLDTLYLPSVAIRSSILIIAAQYLGCWGRHNCKIGKRSRLPIRNLVHPSAPSLQRPDSYIWGTTFHLLYPPTSSTAYSVVSSSLNAP